MKNQVIPNGSKVDTKYEGNCWRFDIDEVSLIEESKVSNAKQPKFKAGDVVVRTGSSYQDECVIRGNHYTVKDVTENGRLILDGVDKRIGTVGFYSKLFELAPEKKKLNYREMQPTDMVKVCVGDNEFEVPLGDLVHARAILGVTNGSYGFKLWDALTKALGEDGFVDDLETLFEFRDKQNEAIDYFFQPSYDKQKQKEELSSLILSKQKELSKLIDKLNQL